jgi:hypothetical protein
MPPPHIEASPINLGIVTLDAMAGWSFYPLEDRLIGRPMNGVGGVSIVRVPASRVPWPASHELCMAAAVETSGFAITPPGTDRAKYMGETCLAGGESFDAGTDFVRIWYRHCPDGMVAAWFACKATRVTEKSVMDAIREADHMIATVRLPAPVS